MKSVESQLSSYQGVLESQLQGMEQQKQGATPGLLKIFHGISKLFSSEAAPAEDRFEKQTQLIRYSFSQAQLARQAGKFQDAYQWLQKADIQLDVASRNFHRGTQASGDFAEKYLEPLTWGIGIGATLGLAASPLSIAVAVGLGLSAGVHAIGLSLMAHHTPELKIPETAQAPQESTELRSLKEIDLEAEAALQLWKKNPQTKFKMGRFLVESALALENKPENQDLFAMEATEWESFITSLKGFASEKYDLLAVKGVSALTVKRYLGEYVEELGRLCDALNGKGGNCDAQTQAIIAALLDREIPIPKPYVLGIQVYQKHAQPVLFNQETKEVLNLATGKAPEKMGPIYHPNLLIHAYLKGQGIIPPVTEADLLIFKPLTLSGTGPAKEPNQVPAPETNSPLAYPTSNVEFSDAPNPKRAKFSVPFKEELLSQADFIEAVQPYLNASPTKNDVIAGSLAQIEVFIESNGPAITKEDWFLEKSGGLDYFIEKEGDHLKILFRHPSQTEKFKSLPTISMKWEYLQQLSIEALKIKVSSPDMDTLQAFFNGPETFMSHRSGEIRVVRQFHQDLSRIHEQILQAELNFSKEQARKIAPNLFPMPGMKQPEVRWFFYNFIRGKEAIHEWVKQRPDEFFKILNTLSEGERFEFLKLLGEGFYFTEDPLVEFAKKNLTVDDTYPTKPKSEPNLASLRIPSISLAWAETPKSKDDDLVEIELVEDISLPPGEPKPDAKNEAPGISSAPPGVIKISHEAMLDFLLFYPKEDSGLTNGFAPLFQFWDPKMSKIFRRKNTSGALDRIFEKYRDDIICARQHKTPLEFSFHCTGGPPSPEAIPPDLQGLTKKAIPKPLAPFLLPGKTP